MPTKVSILRQINQEVVDATPERIASLVGVLRQVRREIQAAIERAVKGLPGDEKFTPAMYGRTLHQVKHALAKSRGTVDAVVFQGLQTAGAQAGKLATQHLAYEMQVFAGRKLPLDVAATVATRGALDHRFGLAAEQYASHLGEGLRKELAVGVVKGETIDQLTDRVLKTPSGVSRVFDRARSDAERLVRTEFNYAYNKHALDGAQELERLDPTPKGQGYKKEWCAAVDGVTCPNCKEFDGLKAPLDGVFRPGVAQPPLHPRCRCAVVLWRPEWD